jgi:predicted transcriptional regulator YdeE
MTSFPELKSVHQKIGSKAFIGRNKQQKPMISENLSASAIRVMVASTNAMSTLDSALATIAAASLAITQIKEKLVAHTIDMKDWIVVENAAITAVQAVTEVWDKTWAVFQPVDQIIAGLMKVARARVAGFMVEDVMTQVELAVRVQLNEVVGQIAAGLMEVAKARVAGFMVEDMVIQVELVLGVRLNEVVDAVEAWVEVVEATENMMRAINEAVYKWKVREAAMGDILVAAAVEAEVASAMEDASRYASTAKDKATSANNKTLAVVKDKILNVDCVIKKLVYTNHEEKQ